MQVVPQLSVTLTNTPGSLASVTNALKDASVNINALCCTEQGDQTVVHLIVDNPEAAQPALEGASLAEVLELVMQNEPGAIDTIAQKCAAAGVNIRNIYATTHGDGAATVYVDVDDTVKAQEVLS